MADLGDRFRLVANEIDVVEPDAAAAEPAGRPRGLGAAARLRHLGRGAGSLAGGPHHTVLTTAVGAEELTDLAEIFSTELVVIDDATTNPSLREELRWSAAYHRLAARCSPSPIAASTRRARALAAIPLSSGTRQCRTGRKVAIALCRSESVTRWRFEAALTLPHHLARS